ncbi:GNAT family N-acetyltransferase [candidate division GN15 bacterium]|nr:GNAT family N-acetyltransferase [candidate division GN15 bacterium]
MDILRDLGYLAFASRLKRLAERLMKDCSHLYRDSGLDFEARWFSTLFALKQHSPQGVTELADHLGLTHPAVNQVVGTMEKKKLVTTKRDRADERRRLVSITARGRKLLDDLQPLLIDIKEATRELVEETGVDLMTGLDRLEAALNQTCMHDRLSARAKQRLLDQVEIVSYRPAYKRHFRELNEVWLKEHFSVDPHDRKLLTDPHGQIVKKGGEVFFAKLDGGIVGTAALIRHDKSTYELAKMAVDPEARGRQAGKKLALATIDKARSLGANRLVLMTSPVLDTALTMYRRLGFREVPVSELDPKQFSRCSITMELPLSSPTGHKRKQSKKKDT